MKEGIIMSGEINVMTKNETPEGGMYRITTRVFRTHCVCMVSNRDDYSKANRARTCP